METLNNNIPLKKKRNVKNKIIIKGGEKYNYLTIIKDLGTFDNGKRYVLCVCKCGTEKKIALTYLRNGHTKSCGCYMIKRTKEASTTHGMNGTRLHSIWRGMKNRCLNKNVKSFRFYGSRGIKVCKEWMEFTPFMEWAINNGYKSNLTIERKDFNGDYCPENCTWIPFKKQAQNTRNSIDITYKGETKCISEWCRVLKIPLQMVIARRLRGWSDFHALSIPKGINNYKEYVAKNA